MFPGYWPVFIEFAQANLDARTQPYQVLQHYIMEIQKYIPKMMDYIRREAPCNLKNFSRGLKFFTLINLIFVDLFFYVIVQISEILIIRREIKLKLYRLFSVFIPSKSCYNVVFSHSILAYNYGTFYGRYIF